MALIIGLDRKWTKTDLTFHFTNEVQSSVLSQAQVIDEFQKAADTWGAVTGLNFSNSDDPGADISITWTDLDGSGDVLGNSTYPDGQNGQVTMKFDNAEDWTQHDVLFSAVNFESVALHEIGHAIGLGHSADPRAVMHETIANFIARTKLSADDEDGAKFLYKNEKSDLMLLNDTDQYVSWFAYNSNDSVKLVALDSGNLSPRETKFYDPVKNGTGKYFIRFTQHGGGTEIAGAIAKRDSLLTLYNVGSHGAHVQIAA